MPTMVSPSAGYERPLWTAEEFLDWLEPGVHADLIDGEKFMHSPINLKHAELVNLMDRLLGAYVQEMGFGKVFREVVAIRLSSRNVFLPDVAFFTNEQVARLAPAHAPFAPTFVMEARSSYTGERDLGPKFAAYEEHGVQECWVLDPEALRHRFYRRQGELLVEFAQGEEIIHSATIPGFWMKRSWLDPVDPPRVLACLSEVLGNPLPPTA